VEIGWLCSLCSMLRSLQARLRICGNQQNRVVRLRGVKDGEGHSVGVEREKSRLGGKVQPVEDALERRV
jgi:hypothetical protein